MKASLPVVKVGHEGWFAETEKVPVCFMDNLRRVGDTLVVDFVEIAEGSLPVFDQFQKRSAEIYPEAAEIAGLALLGTTAPFHDDLPRIDSKQAKKLDNGFYRIDNVPIFKTCERDRFTFDAAWIDKLIKNFEENKKRSIQEIEKLHETLVTYSRRMSVLFEDKAASAGLTIANLSEQIQSGFAGLEAVVRATTMQVTKAVTDKFESLLVGEKPEDEKSEEEKTGKDGDTDKSDSPKAKSSDTDQLEKPTKNDPPDAPPHARGDPAFSKEGYMPNAELEKQKAEIKALLDSVKAEKAEIEKKRAEFALEDAKKSLRVRVEKLWKVGHFANTFGTLDEAIAYYSVLPNFGDKELGAIEALPVTATMLVKNLFGKRQAATTATKPEGRAQWSNPRVAQLAFAWGVTDEMKKKVDEARSAGKLEPLNARIDDDDETE